jgi:hypothetical protein
MRRELPRKVRKALEAAIEKIIGPVEETLKNELEGIVRDCHETLTRSFLDAAQAMVSCPSGCHPQHPHHVVQPGIAINLLGCDSTEGADITMDELSQVALPPDSTRETWSEISKGMEHSKSVPTWSESGYLSQKVMPVPSFDSEVSWQQGATIPEAAFVVNGIADFPQFQPWDFDAEQQPTNHIGKGKERASNHAPRMNYELWQSSFGAIPFSQHQRLSSPPLDLAKLAEKDHGDNVP